MASIFRSVHTIKGTCGFLGLSSLESITHVGEGLLSLLRDGKAVVDADIADAGSRLAMAQRAVEASIAAAQKTFSLTSLNALK